VLPISHGQCHSCNKIRTRGDDAPGVRQFAVQDADGYLLRLT